MEDMTEIEEELENKIAKDYNSFVKGFKSVQEAIANAYIIAIANEVDSLLSNEYGEFVEDFEFTEEEAETIINFKGNFIEEAINTCLNYNHPERVNIFCEISDLIDLVKLAIKNIRR